MNLKNNFLLISKNFIGKTNEMNFEKMAMSSLPLTDNDLMNFTARKDGFQSKAFSTSKHSKSLSRTGTRSFHRQGTVGHESGRKCTTSMAQRDGDYKTVTKRVGGGYSSFAYQKNNLSKPQSMKKESVKVKFLAITKRKSCEDIDPQKLKKSSETSKSKVFSPGNNPSQRLIRKTQDNDSLKMPENDSFTVLQKGLKRFYSLHHERE